MIRWEQLVAANRDLSRFYAPHQPDGEQVETRGSDIHAGSLFVA